MTWGGSALGKLGWRSMPISRKVSLFLLGAGVTVAVMVSLGFWWEEQQRLQSILPQRVERIARLLQEGEEGVRTAEGGQQLVLGKTYPRPMVEHAAARADALAAYAATRSGD